MPLETGDFVSDLVEINPVGNTDDRSTSDDHHRLQKKVMKNSFGGHTGAILLHGSITGTDTYTISVSTPSTLSYVDGMLVKGRVTNANTSSAPTLNLNTLGARTITKYNGRPLEPGDMSAEGLHIFMYDATESTFILVNPTKAAGQYAPNEAATPNMTVLIDPGRMMYNGTLVSNAQQTVTINAADATNPRIDRITISESTGVYTYTAGTPAGSPSVPAIPAGQLPICQVSVPALDTTITNSQITDERVVSKKQAYRGSQVKHSTSVAVGAYPTYTTLTFDSEQFDTSSIHDTVTNNSRLTVPNGVTRVRIRYQISLNSFGGSSWTGDCYSRITMNGSNSNLGNASQGKVTSNALELVLKGETPALTVVAGDYFEVQVTENTTATDIRRSLYSNDTWFEMEIIE